MTKFRKLLDLDPTSEPESAPIQSQLPRTSSTSPQLPEKVLIAPRRKSVVPSSSASILTPKQSRPKKISAQAYRLAPVHRQKSLDPEQVSVALEISTSVMQQVQQILQGSEEGSLSALVDSLLREWLQAQEDYANR